MASWRCPHCGTTQADAARCWACSRSPLACSTCRDFRRSVASRLGYCALDKGREALTGDELRACWQAPPPADDPLPGLFGGLTRAGSATATTATAGASGLPPDPADRSDARAGRQPEPVGPGRPESAAEAVPRWVARFAVAAPRAAAPRAPVDPDTTATDAAPSASPTDEPLDRADRAPAPHWRHPTAEERRDRDAREQGGSSDPPPAARTTALALLPVTLANRLRRHGGDRGQRNVASLPVAAGDPAARAVPRSPAMPGAPGSAAATRPSGSGRLVDAPSVAPSGSLMSLGDQLRRAEQLRAGRVLPDHEGLRGEGRGDSRT